MEVVDDEGVKDIIREELSRLGIHGSPIHDSKRLGYGAKFLNKTVQGSINKTVKNKKKHNVDRVQSNSPVPKPEGSKKSSHKSPFASSKNRSSGKKKNFQQQQMLMDAKV